MALDCIVREKNAGRRDRRMKRWEGNIKKSIGMNFASSTRAAENGTNGKGLS